MAAISGCRSCGAEPLTPILALGHTPLADRLVPPDGLDQPDPMAPLDLVLCPGCGLVQITETVAAELLFGCDYPYFSSVSTTLLGQARDNALELIKRLRLDAQSFVLEIASNDGYLLRNFASRGIPVLGIDPARAPARVAERAGIPTLIEFFGHDVACALRRDGIEADLIVANNVLAHVADLNGLVAGIEALLKPDGMAVLEVPYLVDLIDGCAFDTIYHQHLCYFSLIALDTLFRRHGLFVTEIRRIAAQGGSLRLYAARRERRDTSVAMLLSAEFQRGLNRVEAYTGFVDGVQRVRETLPGLLRKLKGEGARIAACGAAAKGTTLLAVCGIGRELIDYVVDSNPFKQGRYMPGIRLPILAPDHLIADQPDCVLLLPWNLADEILGQHAAYRARGGRFIVPVPAPRVV